ncbi:Peptidase_C39 like family protein [Peptoniphilus asaccharolyticus DSM 20463]|uniref:Peptidase_C39 like family protein n=1 Tax=Peptoniphilus asaccharolyticus DSM 20463 TaxID=573058 RepID=A0A1W1UHV2_PEPAS|nr:C39 family peptidase [Peptoniphilus asaccharolyticus]MBL7574714.1 C39 family peptidase [Peptoniphilus asaccharolyticus]SMB80401.1 Peptidase_C39 like family protein [Peptoniphilus asaccharolyticus DSM 20463]
MGKCNGYEVVDYLYGYITKNYSGAVLVEENSLDLPNFLQNEFKQPNKNCSIVSITRVISYYQDYFSNISEQEIFDQVFTIAKSYGFSDAIGTLPVKIDDIMKDYFRFYGIKIKAKGKYFSNFYNPVKSEIDKGRPLLMNIAFGEYHNHTVTITGYKIFKFKGMNIKFIEVIDGWRKTKTYIDYNIFSHSLLSAGVCSYNTLEILKK